MRDFRKLEVWNEGIDFVELIYKEIRSFPEHEKFALSIQISRSVVSIPSNIAEGCSRDSNKEFSRFLQIAMGSAFELETQLIIANKEGYVSDKQLQTLLESLHVLQRKINALNNAIK